MGEVLPMPAFGDLFTDVRGDDRTMRISYHEDRGVVVLSLWAGTLCRGSFRLATEDLGDLIGILRTIEHSATPPPSAGDDPTQPAPTQPAPAHSGPAQPAPAETGSVTLPEQPTRRETPGTAIRATTPRVA
jgi:hypothetical protein